MDTRDYLSSLRRGLAVLALLNRHSTRTTAQIAKVMDLPRTTAVRIIATLVMEGYVERVPMSRLYRLTASVNMLSSGFSDESWVSHIASPLLFEKTKQIGWPLSLATPFGEDMMVRVSTDQATTLALDHFQIGFKTPIMHSATGHVLLAFSTPVFLNALIGFLKKSENPLQADIFNDDLLNHIIARVRKQGFEHISYSDYAEAGISVPILLEGKIVACLLLIYIKRAIPRDEAEALFVPILRELAIEIERQVLQSKQRIADTSNAAARSENLIFSYKIAE